MEEDQERLVLVQEDGLLLQVEEVVEDMELDSLTPLKWVHTSTCKLEVEVVLDMVLVKVVLEVNLMLIHTEMVKHVMEMVVVDLHSLPTLVAVAVEEVHLIAK